MIKDVATNFSEQQRVVIIVPTYNEEQVIHETLSELLKLKSSMTEFEIEILIFDSASSDGTKEQVLRLQKDNACLHLQTEPKKTGLGSAYLQAMRYAIDTLKADIVFEFDADLSHQPKYISSMLEELKSSDVVIGSRYVKGGSIPANWGLERTLFSVIGNYISRLLLTFKYKDFTSGFRATRVTVLKKILPDKFLSNHYAYKLQLLWLLHKTGARIKEFPITFIDREKGLSKLPKNAIIDSLRVVFTLRYYELKRYFKMCLVGLCGMAVQFILYNLLRNYLNPFSATQIAVLAAISNNFIFNARFTFKDSIKQNNAFKRLMHFSFYSLSMVFLQSEGMQAAVYCFGKGIVLENIYLLVIILLASFLNYFIYSFYIWPRNPAQDRSSRVGIAR